MLLGGAGRTKTTPSAILQLHKQTAWESAENYTVGDDSWSAANDRACQKKGCSPEQPFLITDN
jgi:hypothetical protein